MHWRVWFHLPAHKSEPGRPGLASTNQNLHNKWEGMVTCTADVTTLQWIWQWVCAYLRSERRVVCRSWSDFSVATSVHPGWRQWGSAAAGEQGQTGRQLKNTHFHIWIGVLGSPPIQSHWANIQHSAALNLWLLIIFFCHWSVTYLPLLFRKWKVKYSDTIAHNISMKNHLQQNLNKNSGTM